MAQTGSSGNPGGGPSASTSAIRQFCEPDLSPLHLLPYEEFCDAADQYERQLRNTIARLREMRNDRNPHAVQRLPTELLVQIFTDVSRISDPRSSRSLIALTHVRRKWRAIALDIPGLWSSIVVTSLSSDGVHAFIGRSRDSLFNIRLQDPHEQVDFQFLSKLQRRLRSLIVEATGLAAAAQVTKQLAWRPTPHLEALCILAPSADGVWAEILGFDLHPPPSENAATTQTLQSSSPSLRYLHMRPMVVPWTSGVYSNLSVLDIETSPLTGLTEGRLISILRRCPELVELRLRVKGDLKGSTPPNDGSWDVALPLLSVFSVDGISPELAASILSHLTLPAFTRYTLSLFSTWTFVGPFVAALPLDWRRLPGLAAITGVTFEMADDGNVRVTLCPANNAPTVALTLANEARNMTLPCVPTAASESLEVIKTIGPPSSSMWAFALDWHAVFCHLPRLRHLLFDKPTIEDLLLAIDALGRPGGGPHTLPFPCPALECLELVGLPLTRDLGSRLVNALRRRDEWGFPPLSLKVRDAIGSDDEFLSCLRELEVNVAERCHRHIFTP